MIIFHFCPECFREPELVFLCLFLQKSHFCISIHQVMMRWRGTLTNIWPPMTSGNLEMTHSHRRATWVSALVHGHRGKAHCIDNLFCFCVLFLFVKHARKISQMSKCLLVRARKSTNLHIMKHKNTHNWSCAFFKWKTYLRHNFI